MFDARGVSARYVYLGVSADNSSSLGRLYRWNRTVNYWDNYKSVAQGMVLALGLGYLEFLVGKEY